MRGVSNKRKRLEDRYLRSTINNRKRRKRRVVDKNSGKMIRKMEGKPGKRGTSNTKKGVEMLK